MTYPTLQTAAQMHVAIAGILLERAVGAQKSEYDRGVCIRAVGVARIVFQSIPIEGTGTEYGQAVVAALQQVYETYNDPDGEYTSGKGSIGDVFIDISNLLRG